MNTIQRPPQSVQMPLTKGHLNRSANQPMLGVKRKLWRRDDDHAHLADAAFAPVQKEVLQRDNYTCRFCTFKAAKHQEVHHIDDNHQNNDKSNLLTTCNLCHQVHHLGMCAMRNAGFLAAIPELTQCEVNNLVRAIHVSELMPDAAVRDKLKGLYALFQHRGSDTLKVLYGVDISNPYFLTDVLSNCTDEMYAKRGELLAPLRLVATKEAFRPAQLEYYAVNNQPLFRPENWAPLARQLLM